MVAAWNTPHPDPIAPLGRRLCEIFGQHPWDFIQAPNPGPHSATQWKTITDYPLRPRVLWAKWQDPDQLIGVRFNSPDPLRPAGYRRRPAPTATQNP
jgi:hypothetical protein